MPLTQTKIDQWSDCDTPKVWRSDSMSIKPQEENKEKREHKPFHKEKQGRSYSTKKKKIIASVELTEKGNIKRVYALKINDYSSKSLGKLFEKHISTDANIDTDKWKGYRPLMKEYNITQSLSDKGQGMPQMHIVIHQIKSWLRTIYSWVHPEHIDSYLDEFSFRINRSIYKKTIFHKIMERVVQSEHLSYNMIVVANK